VLPIHDTEVLSFSTDVFLSKLYNSKGRQLFDSDPRSKIYTRNNSIKKIRAIDFKEKNLLESVGGIPSV